MLSSTLELAMTEGNSRRTSSTASSRLAQTRTSTPGMRCKMVFTNDPPSKPGLKMAMERSEDTNQRLG
jgi:hypothetical protein